MNYEEKYKEVFKRAKAIIRFYKNQNRDDVTSIKDLELIFPELKESEDEKIRKMMIRYFESCGNLEWYDGLTPQKAIDWLEKQKPSEWSEEDDRIIDNIETYINIASNDAHTREECIKETKDWLKSVKQRIKGE